MTVQELKAKIKSKHLPHYLIFSGEEWKVQEIYIKQISKALSLETQRVDSVLQIYKAIQSKSLFKKNIIYIVRDDKDLMQNEKLQQQIEQGVL